MRTRLSAALLLLLSVFAIAGPRADVAGPVPGGVPGGVHDAVVRAWAVHGGGPAHGRAAAPPSTGGDEPPAPHRAVFRAHGAGRAGLQGHTVFLVHHDPTPHVRVPSGPHAAPAAAALPPDAWHGGDHRRSFAAVPAFLAPPQPAAAGGAARAPPSTTR
ncbi:hypothetical protein [Nonomuraea pusilla]|uniref:Secreted protein n=1 Tax=Nonomuraea pusilla TaxID=46177 RepID=A0A1H7U851_9ACTN|nr:hypothetical protein [Nonomuraea pusilla]SEL92818.1 hypothetical protein SAMN05660976_03696 [Nonomuraea pusilla]